MAQTVRDIEIFIIGDGMTPATAEAADALQRSDPRIRLFAHPKGPRHGEIYRHAALAEATGRIICYLSDDDLWLPKHVATMEGLLANADFAHTLSIRVETDGGLRVGNKVDFGIPGIRDLALTPGLRVGGTGLSCTGGDFGRRSRRPMGHWHRAGPVECRDVAGGGASWRTRPPAARRLPGPARGPRVGSVPLRDRSGKLVGFAAAPLNNTRGNYFIQVMSDMSSSDSGLGLLAIPAGFFLIVAIVAGLFLTVHDTPSAQVLPSANYQGAAH